jgi:hypothetical protein
MQFEERCEVATQVRYPFSELMDRLTIEMRKAHYGKENASILADYYKALREKLGVRIADFLWNTIILAEANTDIANLEWAIRTNKELSTEEVGRRALAIREINNLRCMAKATLGQYVGEKTDSGRYDQKEKFTSILQPRKPLTNEEAMILGEMLQRKKARHGKTAPTRSKNRS